MSGVEVAGLVLGAIPIVTAALKELDHTTDKFQRFRKWKSDLPSFVRRLNSQRICLVRSLHLLFRLSDLPLPDLNDLEKDSKSSLWRNADVVSKLKAKHGEVYEAVESDFIAILSSMKLLCEKLGLGTFVTVTDLKTTWSNCLSTPGSRLKFRDRVTYTISGDGIRQLLNEIDNRQQSIRGVLSDIHTLAQLPQEKGGRKLHSQVIMVQRDATMIHAALLGAINCKEHSHCAKMELDGDWEDVIISATSGHQRSFRVSVSALDSDQLIFVEVNVVPHSSKTDHELSKRIPATHLTNFCDDHRMSKPQIQRVGLHIDERSGTIFNEVHVPLNTAKRLPQQGPAPHRFVSLTDALQPSLSNNGSNIKTMSEGHRKKLLARISAYALVLESTPWRSETWRTEDIEFLLNDTGSSQGCIDFRRPFVPHSPRSCQSEPFPGAESRQKPWNTSRQFALHLCLLIMELCLGEKVLPRTPVDASAPPQIHRCRELEVLTNLLEWKEARWDDFSATIRDVITCCLCLAIRPSFSLRKEEDLESAIQNIVLPMKSEHDVFAGKTLTS